MIETQTRAMLHFLDKALFLFLAGILFFSCNQSKQKNTFCDFNTDLNGRVRVAKNITSPLSLKTKTYLLKKWSNEANVFKRTDNHVFSEDSTTFSARALFPFIISHPSEKDTIFEKTNLKFDIHIELKHDEINYYLLDFQLYYEVPENPFLGGGRMKGVNDKEYLNKYTQHCNPTKQDFLEISEVIEKELRQIPAYFKTPPPKKIIDKYVTKIVEQAEQISLKAQEEIKITTNSIEDVFLKK